MRAILSFLRASSLLWLLLVGGFAHAVINPSSGYTAKRPDPGTSSPDVLQATGNSWSTACAAGIDAFKAKLGTGTENWRVNTEGDCRLGWSGGTYSGGSYPFTVAQESICPANSVLSGGTCQCNPTYTESGGQCVQNQCAANAGQLSKLNITIGYTRTGDSNDTKAIGGVFNPWAPGATVCSAGCTMEFSEATDAWVSQAPGPTGLYRNSIDAVYRNSGTPCTASSSSPADQSVKTDAAIPPCPGYVGEINGKLGCYGTAQAPVTGEPKPAGAQPSPVAGNPAAGAVPTSGEGSGTGAGRTPNAGNGGPAGGPAGAAVGGRGGTGGGTPSGTGTVSTPGSGEEQAECGAPGQPRCAIDETGTPQSSGTSFDSANTQLGTNQSTVESAINAAHGLQAPSWSFSFQLPTGCSQYQVASFKGHDFKLNPCQYQGMIHDLMSLVWAAVTAFCLIRMVGNAIRSS